MKQYNFLNQKYLRFSKFRKNNIFEKNKNVFINFFKTIFQKEGMKKLMIDIFPYLENNYIINDKFIDEFFNKIKTINFQPNYFCGEIIYPVLNIYIKNYFEANDNIEAEICAISSLIIIIFHLFSNYIRFYICIKASDSKYKKSFGLNNCDEIGDYFESLLFSKTLFTINFYQSIFLLNEMNYGISYEYFSQDFKKLEVCKNKKDMNKFHENFIAAKLFLKEMNVFIEESQIIKTSIIFPIKNGNNYIILGYNNDKGGRSVEISKIFKGSSFECLLSEK